MNARGIVISVHALGATVRLEDGQLAAVPAPEVARERSKLLGAMSRREPLALLVERRGRHLTALLAPGSPQEPAALRKDDAFESMMNAYLKSLEDHEPPDWPGPADRHFIRKKRRATIFESRHRES